MRSIMKWILSLILGIGVVISLTVAYMISDIELLSMIAPIFGTSIALIMTGIVIFCPKYFFSN